jgi:hypothetical protein
VTQSIIQSQCHASWNLSIVLAQIIASASLSHALDDFTWSPPVFVAEKTSLYHLVIQGHEDNALLIFVGSDPNLNNDGETVATPVTLQLLPPCERFGGSGVAMGRPVLGRWPSGIDRFRQFLTFTEMEQAGWVYVPRYRICDSWEDYYAPWSIDEKQSANLMSIGQMCQEETLTSQESVS